jgi:hypothetical protein
MAWYNAVRVPHLPLHFDFFSRIPIGIISALIGFTVFGITQKKGIHKFQHDAPIHHGGGKSDQSGVKSVKASSDRSIKDKYM